MNGKWRPSLAQVLGGALAGTLAMSFAGLVALRYLGPVIGFKLAAGILGLIIAVATAVLGWMLIRLLLRPIRALEQYAATLETDPENAIPQQHFGTRELRTTAQRVVTMAQALRNREASIRAYTDHVTHELKTPVSAIRAGAELLQDGPPLPPEAGALVDQIDGARVQIEAQLAALRRTAEAREARYLGRTRLSEVANTLPDNLAITLNGADHSLPIAAEGLQIVLAQLTRNAAEAGATAITLSATTPAQLTVHDNGPGISSGNADRVFDPFFTTRREVGGTGVGLAIVRNILAAHGGDIALIHSDNGAKFQIRFTRPG